AEQTRAGAREIKLDVLFIDDEFMPLLPKDFDDCPVIVAHEFGDTIGLTREAEEALPMDSNIRDALALEDHATRSEDWPSLSLVLRTTPAEQTIPSRPRRGRTIILTSGTTGTPARHPPPGAAELPAGILDHEPDPAQGAPPVLPGSPDVPHLGFCQYPAGARAPLDDGDAAQVPPRRCGAAHRGQPPVCDRHRANDAAPTAGGRTGGHGSRHEGHCGFR